MGQKRLRALGSLKYSSDFKLFQVHDLSNFPHALRRMPPFREFCAAGLVALQLAADRWHFRRTRRNSVTALVASTLKTLWNQVPSAQGFRDFPRFSFYYACFWWESSENDLQDLQSGAVQEVVLTVSFRCRPFRPCRGNCEIGLKSDELVRICRRLSEMVRFHWCSTLIRHSFGPKLNIVSVQSVQSVQSVFLLKLLKCI